MRRRNRIREQHLRLLRLDGPLGLAATGPFVLEVGEQTNAEVRVVEDAVDGHVGRIRAMTTDRRQHLMRHPTFELFCFGLAGLHHQTVQTSFGDDGFIWISRNTVGNNDGVLLIGIKFANRITIVRDAQHVAHVLGDEPRLAFLVAKDADLVALEIELLDFIVHWILLRIVFIGGHALP